MRTFRLIASLVFAVGLLLLILQELFHPTPVPDRARRHYDRRF